MTKDKDSNRLNVALKNTDEYFYVYLPTKKSGEKSVRTPRLSQIEDPNVRRDILNYLSKSAADGEGADLVFDISSDGRIIGVEFLL